jgi:hypothetical protein
MGLFLSLNSVVGKSAAEVANSLSNFARNNGGGLEPSAAATLQSNGCCIQEANGNTTIVFPDSFMDWDDAAAFLSGELKAPVFSFHIHDSDLWMYILYADGADVDQFNPVPEYWDDTIDEDERDYWKGDSSVLTSYLPHINPADIENYLVHWDEDMDPDAKAYPDDEYHFEDFQLTDFMRKLQLPFPLNDNFEPTGSMYFLHTKELKPGISEENGPAPANTIIRDEPKPTKPWWKFW